MPYKVVEQNLEMGVQCPYCSRVAPVPVNESDDGKTREPDLSAVPRKCPRCTSPMVTLEFSKSGFADHQATKEAESYGPLNLGDKTETRKGTEERLRRKIAELEGDKASLEEQLENANKEPAPAE